MATAKKAAPKPRKARTIVADNGATVVVETKRKAAPLPEGSSLAGTGWGDNVKGPAPVHGQ